MHHRQSLSGSLIHKRMAPRPADDDRVSQTKRPTSQWPHMQQQQQHRRIVVVSIVFSQPVAINYIAVYSPHPPTRCIFYYLRVSVGLSVSMRHRATINLLLI